MIISKEKRVLSLTKKVWNIYIHSKTSQFFFGCVDSPQGEDLFANMEWAIDKETGVIQLTKLIPLDILYQAQHVDGYGPTWQQYYKDLADYIVKYNPESVLEIGGGQGQLATFVTDKLKNLNWTIVEPNSWHEGNDRIKTVPAFFDKNFSYDKKVDAVVFSQVLEHAFDPNEFISAISKFLKPGGKLIFAYPQLEVWLKNKFTNALNFEHTMFLTDYFVDFILESNSFKILDKYTYKTHSHFYVAERLDVDTPAVNLAKLDNKYESYKEIFNDFIKYHQDMVDDINKKN